MKATTRKIIREVLSSDDSLTDSHRKLILKVLSDPQAVTVPNNGDAKLMTSITRAARMYDVSSRTISRWIESGELDAVRLSNSTIRIPIENLQSLNAEKKQLVAERDGKGRFAKNKE